MRKVRELIQAAIVRPPFTSPLKGDEVFPALDDTGWDFTTPAAITVPVVVDPDGLAYVGVPDEDGILWLSGCAFVLEDGDARHAKSNSISFTKGCRAGRVTTAWFRVERGFGQEPVLRVLSPVLIAAPA